MARLFLTVWGCLFVPALLAQGSFFRTYAAPATSVFQRPVWTTDASGQPVVATALFKAQAANPYHLGLFAFDLLGNIRWQTSLVSENRDLVVTDIKTGPDGGLYVCGMWGLSMGSLPKPFLVAFDSEGRFRWSRWMPLQMVSNRIRLACRANEIGLGCTVDNNFYDFALLRFSYQGAYRGGVAVGGNNAEDIFKDLGVQTNGNFIALVETNSNNPGRRAAGLLLFNSQSGISASYLVETAADMLPNQLYVAGQNDFQIGAAYGNQYVWLQSFSNSTLVNQLFSIDSLPDYASYQALPLRDRVLLQGPAGNDDGKISLIRRGEETDGWQLQHNIPMYSGGSAPLSVGKRFVLFLGTQSGTGTTFSEKLLLIRTNEALDNCYENKSALVLAAAGTGFNKASYALSGTGISDPPIDMRWTPVSIRMEPGEPDCYLFANAPVLPTAFTPNGDGLNETFGPVDPDIPSYTLRIFDRWGRKMFEGTNTHWDGTLNGNKVSTGFYPYVIDYADLKGRESRISGECHLIH